MKLVKFAFVFAAALLLAANSYAQNPKRLSLEGVGDLRSKMNFQALENILLEVGKYPAQVRLTDISAAASHYTTSGVTGKIIEIEVAIEAALDNTAPGSTLNFEINGISIPDPGASCSGAVGDGNGNACRMKIPYGVEASSVFRVTGLAAAVTPGSRLEVGSDGGSSGTSIASVTFIIQRYPLNE